LPIELQLVAHYTPLQSGLALLPLTIVMLVFSARSGQLSARIGPRLQMSVGPVLVGAGIALLARATDPGNYATQVLPGVMLLSVGLAVTVAPLTATAMGAAPAEHSGIASAVNNTVARAAGLFAVAVLPLLAGLTGAAALSPEQLSTGFRTAVYISGVTCALGGLIAVLTIRNPARAAAPAATRSTWNCGVSGPPLQPLVTVAAAAAGPGPGAGAGAPPGATDHGRANGFGPRPS
jgi:MFS family permease